MPKCPKCHGAGFTLHQVAWSMDRVRILCKTCDGRYTYKKVMTPAQRKQLANILLKEGEEGWKLERKHVRSPEWLNSSSDHTIDCHLFRYRAVRIERTPIRTTLPIEHYKRGMEVQFEGAYDYIILGDNGDNLKVILARVGGTWPADYRGIQKWRWPNETEWHPAYTETVEERVVETLIVEGL